MKKKTLKLLGILYKTISLIIVIIALGYLLSSNFFPIVKVETQTMEPLFKNGDILLCYKTTEIKRGDNIVFYIGNKLQIKKVIGMPGETLSIDNKGNIYIDGNKSEYSNINNKLGDIEYPLIIQEREYFVLNEDRLNVKDSRSKEIGNIKQDDIYAKVIKDIWPGGKNND